MLCNQCSSKLTPETKFCPSCGNKVPIIPPVWAKPSIEDKAEPKISDNISLLKNFILKLWRGDHGLLITFWIYNILTSFVASIFIAMLGKSILLILLILPLFCYDVLVTVGAWRAATKYSGQKIWSILAKITCILKIFITLKTLL